MIKFRIKKHRQKFLILIGTKEDKGRDYSPIKSTFFAEILPILKQDFTCQDSAIAAMKELKKILSSHWLYGS